MGTESEQQPEEQRKNTNMTTTNTLSPAQIMSLVAVNAERNTAAFKDLTPQNGWFFAETMGEFIQADPRVAFLGLVEILMRQTTDERINGGTCHKNKFGFSKKHVTRGSELALKYLNGTELDTTDVTDAINIAFSYREQLWMVRMGAVPVNMLNLRPIRNIAQPSEIPASE